MADPVIAGVYRSMIVLAGSSGLPEDRFITTWCFRADAAVSVEVAAGRISNALISFLNDPNGVESSVCAFIGPQASRVTDASKIVTYDLGTPPERVPHVVPFTLGPPMAGVGGNGMPAEVACCLSMRTEHPGPSGLGRVYIGPIVSGAGFAGTFQEWRPTPALRNSLGLAAGTLKTTMAAGGSPLPWAVLSHKLSTAYAVTGGWVDDAWDTQRRRGLVATGRTLWPIP